MRKVDEYHVKRIYELELGDVFKMHITDCWKQVRGITDIHVKYSTTPMISNERGGTIRLETVHKHSHQIVHFRINKNNTRKSVELLVRAQGAYSNGTPYNIAKELGNLNKFYEN